ncbi:MAG: ATP synthase F1 subunit delta [Clostridia bacterium]|nr:ATP synthase F1 subunit delta [Clostridia bacterium]
MNEFSRVYGEALYELSSEESRDAAILTQVRAVDVILRDEPAYAKLISARSLPVTERLSLLDEAFGNQVDATLLNFLKILCQRGAFDQFHGCADVFETLYNDRHNIMPVTVVTAVALDERQRKRLIDALQKKTGKTIQLTEKVEPELRGGIRCEMAGKRLDNSILTKMDSLRRSLSKKS